MWEQPEPELCWTCVHWYDSDINIQQQGIDKSQLTFWDLTFLHMKGTYQDIYKLLRNIVGVRPTLKNSPQEMCNEKCFRVLFYDILNYLAT